MRPLRVFVGWDEREPAAYHVLCHSILSRARGPVAITPLVRSTLTRAGLYRRVRTPSESTDFSMTRFLTPHLAGYEGPAIFMDCDMLCLGDVFDLLHLAPPEAAVSVCQHDYVPKTATKFLGQSQTTYPRKNWSSMMVFRTGLCRPLTPSYVSLATPMDLHRLSWVGDLPIGSLPLEWNWLVGEYEPNPAAKILHFTIGGPWFPEFAGTDHADLWFDEAKRAGVSVS